MAEAAVCEAVIDGFESRATLGDEHGATGKHASLAGFNALVELETAWFESGVLIVYLAVVGGGTPGGP